MENGRAVLFWIYGGSLAFGNAGRVEYDGSGFASYQDVIVVTVNYRMNGKTTTFFLPTWL
jgi:carboxylesterase type B